MKEKQTIQQPITVDFSKVPVELSFEGEAEMHDLRKIIGNAIRKSVSDIGMDEEARKIYFSSGEVEIKGEYREPIISVIMQSDFVVPVKLAIRNLLTIKKEGERV